MDRISKKEPIAHIYIYIYEYEYSYMICVSYCDTLALYHTWWAVRGGHGWPRV